MNLIVVGFVKNTIPIIQFYKSYILTNSKVSAIAAKDSGTSESKLHFLYTIYVCVCVCVGECILFTVRPGELAWRPKRFSMFRVWFSGRTCPSPPLTPSPCPSGTSAWRVPCPSAASQHRDAGSVPAYCRPSTWFHVLLSSDMFSHETKYNCRVRG